MYRHRIFSFHIVGLHKLEGHNCFLQPNILYSRNSYNIARKEILSNKSGIMILFYLTSNSNKTFDLYCEIRVKMANNTRER